MAEYRSRSEQPGAPIDFEIALAFRETLGDQIDLGPFSSRCVWT